MAKKFPRKIPRFIFRSIKKNSDNKKNEGGTTTFTAKPNVNGDSRHETRKARCAADRSGKLCVGVFFKGRRMGCIIE